MTTIQRYIRQLREENKLTQAEFGAIIGVSNKVIWTWEKGFASPSVEQLIKLATHFDLELDYFVTGVQKKEQEERIEKYAALLSKIEQLDPEDRWKLEGRIDTILEGVKYVDRKE